MTCYQHDKVTTTEVHISGKTEIHDALFLKYNILTVQINKNETQKRLRYLEMKHNFK